MQEEFLGTLTQDERPVPEELDGYVRRYDLSPDLVPYRKELSDWIHDFQRQKELDRDKPEGGTPLYGHSEAVERGRSGGFDPNAFDIAQVVSVAKNRPTH